MKKKALVVATVVGFIANFEYNDICRLQDMGYEVHIASDMSDCNNKEKLKRLLDSGAVTHDIKFYRNPFKLGNIKAYRQLKELAVKEKFDLLHCHTPVGGVFGRLVGHSAGIKRVIYTAHGFHFYKGAPLKNWLLYYPVEWLCSWWTDTLITINKEDYARAKKHLHAKRTEYIPGIGVDTKQFAPQNSGREKIRKELGLTEDRIMLLSVGELNENKNHRSVIKAIKGIEDLTYVIAGKGKNSEDLKSLAKETEVDLRLVGYRTDVADFYGAADVYVLPSIREGLNVSLMESMASGCAVACGRIRGNMDLIEDQNALFDPLDPEEIKKAILYAVEHRTELGQKNLEKIKSFDLSIVKELSSKIYRG